MKTILLPAVLLSLGAGAVAGALAGRLSAPASTSGEALAAAPSELDALAASLSAVSHRQEQLARSIDDLRASASGPSRVPLEDFDAAIERYLAKRANAAGDEPAQAEIHGTAASNPELDAQRRVDQAMEQLLADDVDDGDVQTIWGEMAKAGLSDQLVAAFEARVEREPNDPDRRVELGHAYLQKIFEVGNGPLAGVWAMKADSSFDKALALDEGHWDARFSKAVSLSFWPPAMGKQNAAIEQFEVLIQNQQSQPKDSKYAQSYLFLGNMYQQTGQPEKALAMWQEGYALYPEDSGLQSQVALSQKK
jgi:tetratricopeptide (TPR) repeat protein